jgi:hypothetical protein
MVLRKGRRATAALAFVATALCMSILTITPANAAQAPGSPAASATAGSAAAVNTTTAATTAGSTSIRVPVSATVPAQPPLELGLGHVVTGDCAAVRTAEVKAAARGVHKEDLCSSFSRTPARAATATATAKSAAASGNAVTSPTTYWCAKQGTAIWVVNRHYECISGLTDTVTATLNGDVVGLATFTIGQNISPSAVSGIFTEDDTIVFSSASGVLDFPTTLTLDASCTNPCSTLAGNDFGEISPGGFLHFHDAFEDTPAASSQDSVNTLYVLEVAPPPTFPPANPAEWGSAAPIRCDNTPTLSPKTGCVMPQYIPGWSASLAEYGGAAANVAVGEALISGTPGQSPNTPLTRLINPTLQALYGNLMCGNGTFRRIVEVTDDSCDEYPFKSTNQSGGAFGVTGPSCIQAVPFLENGVWNVDIIGNYNPANTYVCQIGHVTESQNELLGSHLSGFYNRNRIINGDAYWIGVTA